MKYILGLDIGGTHISGGVVDIDSGRMIHEHPISFDINAADDRSTVIEGWTKAVKYILESVAMENPAGMGVSMPGPFDYENGISFIKGLGKYDALYGIDIKNELLRALEWPEDFPVYFDNDAICFALGEYNCGSAAGCHKIVAVTLGTGMGAAFLKDGDPVQEGRGVPPGGTLYQVPYDNSIAEDHFSARGLVKQYEELSGKKIANVQLLSDYAAKGDVDALKTFSRFGNDMASFLAPWMRLFQAECLVLGGNISRAFPFFRHSMQTALDRENIKGKILLSGLKEKAAILGAAGLVWRHLSGKQIKQGYRKTNQYLLALQRNRAGEEYDIYPAFHLEGNKVHCGMDALSDYIIAQKTVVIDGYAGIFWDKLKSDIRNTLPKDLKINIQDTGEWLLPEEEIETIIRPYLGVKGSVWGKKSDKRLSDFFDPKSIATCLPDPASDINILVGTGAALSSWQVPVIYFDLPKNELQYRMRAGKITNLGNNHPEAPDEMYKRFYFVDWVVLNRHKKNILRRISIVADGQHPDAITWMYFNDLEKALQIMSQNVFRVRPWFEPGAWGGQWIKRNIRGINENEINYAWSFELITPENGLLVESGGWMFETSFDILMLLHHGEVLGGKYAERFGDEFPIRFDFLDTVEGGNLSIQCHPSVRYIRENFGERFTQDETYYILEADKGSGVYLGFQQDIDPVRFRKDLEESYEKNVKTDVTKYVQYHPSKKHDLFLIPNGTVHSAGAGNLVLEISATPYIFTFKMYDWLRPDLNGEPRPINIEHAFHNLNFERKGEKVKEELISAPYLLDSGKDWKLFHLPTHPEHFYDVHRYEFKSSVTINTEGSCHVLMLVEGKAVSVETKNGFLQRFYYAETFVIPAAAESYNLINEGKEEIKVVKAFLK